MALLSQLSPRKRLKIIIRFIAILIAFAGTFFAAINIQKFEFRIAFFFSLLVVLASIIEFIISDILTEKIYPLRTQQLFNTLELKLARVRDGVITKLREAVENLKGCDKNHVNVTVHLKVNFFSSIDDKIETGLVQLTDYYGNSSGASWRITSCYKGIIGRCLRTGEPEYVNFANEEEYEDRMIKEFGFTKSETEARSKNARSYYAYPIIINNQLIGVLYLYSTDFQVFPNSVDERKIASVSRDITMLLKAASIV